DPADRPNPRLPFDERELRHINVTRGAGNIAVLKNGGRLSWPAAFNNAAFQEPRDRLGALALEAARPGGRLDPVSVRQMAASVEQLRALLRPHVNDLSFHSYTEARDLLHRFNDAV